MKGRLTKNVTGWYFDADEDGTHHELHVVASCDDKDSLDCGEYEVLDSHGRKWTVIDVEDDAEMLEGWSD